ncbi:MAG: RNA-dependent RNA polymerase [Hangzhou nephotettix cincticeps rhabdovirus 1]|nr:MAG: RNA-dependent RNA polymerase [Hangzhou nephotettix cincticeps rhabdovirus 1]
MSAICLPTVLDSPLLEWTLLETWSVWMGEKKPRNSRIKRQAAELCALHQVTQISESLSFFCQNLQSLPFCADLIEIPSTCLEEFSDFISLTIPIVAGKVSKSSWRDVSYDHLQQALLSLKSHRKYPFLLKLYYWKWWYEQIVVASSRPGCFTKFKEPPEPGVTQTIVNQTSVYSSTSVTGLNLDVTSSFCHIFQADAEWLVTRDHLLMLSDSAAQRFNCLLSSILGEIFNDSSLPRPELLLKVMEWGDDIVNQLKNEGYRAIKMWEPLVTAYLLASGEDPLVNVHKFKEMMDDEFRDSVPENSHFLLVKLNRFREMMDEALEQGSRGALTQLFGLYRLWGHPTVSGLMGVNKLRQITQQHRGINQMAIRQVYCKWREYFTISYYHQHTRLPRFKEKSFKTVNYTTECLKLGELPSKNHPNYDVMQWSTIEFDQNFNIPERFDFSDLIADKATSFGFEELKKRCENFGDIGPGADRSVIIRWLKQRFISPIDFLNNISRNGFPPDERVAGVFPKEREGKNEPRLFGIMPLIKRLYIVLTEALIAEFILPLFPEITMTFNSVTLTQRLYSCTKGLGEEGKGYEEIVTNLDFLKWNSYMREEETLQIFSDFDDLFGIQNVFSRSHQLFNPCFFYLADGSITPLFDRDRMILDLGTWSDHLGGIEGLRQKGWTVFTVVILKMIADRMNIRSQLLGQGDNQVLINRYYPRPGKSITEQHDDFMDNLENFLSSIGPPLKMEESWTSSKYFVYGKVPFYEGVPLPMSLKKTCRMHRLNNDGIINLDGTLSSISANASAAVSTCNVPIIPLFISVFESLGAIKIFLDRPFYGECLLKNYNRLSIRIPNDGVSMMITERVTPFLHDLLAQRKKNLLIQILSIFPSALGGYPVVQISDLIIRGFPDPVTAAIWELKLLLESPINRDLREAIVRILSPRLNPVVNPELLCQDPTGLNLLRGSRPKDKIKRFVVDFLVNMPDIQNEEFREFLRLATLDQRPLSNALFNVEPCHPRVMSEIYNSTVQGRASQCVRKIDKTPVLLNLMCKNHDRARAKINEEVSLGFDQEEGRVVKTPKALGMLFYEFERNQLMGLLFSLNTPSNLDDLPLCSCKRADELRSRSWRKKLHGVSVAFPHELLKRSLLRENLETGFILLSILGEQDMMSWLTQLGPFSPYLGSTSREKVEYQGKKLLSSAPSFLTNAIRSLRFINWGTNEGTRLSNLIYKIFSQFTDADPSWLIPKVGMVSGTLEHRVADMRTSHSGTLSVPFAVSTHASVNTNQFRPGNLDGMSNYGNYNINFQAIFSYIAGDLVFGASTGGNFEPRERLIIRCADCVMGVNEDSLELPDDEVYQKALESEALTTESRFMWISKEDLISLSRKNDISVKLEETPQRAYSPLFTPLSPDQIGSDKDLLALTIIEDLISQHPLFSSDDWSWLYKESKHLLPVSFIPNLDIVSFFDYLGFFFIIKTIYIRAKFWSNIEGEWISDMILNERLKLVQLFPRDWFLKLASLFLFDEIYLLIKSHYPGINPPLGTPPSVEEKATCLHKLFTATINRRLTTEKVNEISSKLKRVNLPSSCAPCFHPQIINLVSRFIRESGKTNKSEILRILRTLREKEGEQGGYPNNLDLRTLELKFPDNEKIIRPSVLSLSESKLVEEYTKFNLPVQVSADWISKDIGKRVNIPRTLPIDQVDNKNASWKISNLPLAVEWVTLRVNLSDEVSSIRLPEIERESYPNPINSLYKVPVLITSAPYKLLSIYASSKKLGLPRPKEVRTVLCSGDGSGGFSVITALRYPQAQVIFNSFYDASKLSSVGIDRYIPAAFVLSGMDPKRVLGIEFMEEGISDLTEEKIVEQFTEEINRDIELITCDAEGGGFEDPSKGLMMIQNLTHIARLKNTRCMIFKTFLSRMDLVIAQVNIMYSKFSTVHVVRSEFSGYGNTEVYLCGVQPVVESKPPLQWYIDEQDQINLRGSVLSENESKAIQARLEIGLNLYKDCSISSKYYTSCLKQIFPTSIDPSLELLLMGATSSFKALRLHPNVMDVIRSVHLPTKFHKGGGSNEELLLSLYVIKKIATPYISIVLAALPDSMIKTINLMISESHLVAYENLGGSWSLALRNNPKLCTNFKSWKLKDLMEDQRFSKTIFSTVRQVKEYCKIHGFPILSQARACEDELQTNFPTDSPTYFKGLGIMAIPFSEMPMLGPNQELYKPKNYLPRELDLPKEFVNCMISDSVKVPRLKYHVPGLDKFLNRCLESKKTKKLRYEHRELLERLKNEGDYIEREMRSMNAIEALTELHDRVTTN